MTLAIIALGGGYGHVCRAIAARHTLGRSDPTLLVVSSPGLPASIAPGCALIPVPQGLPPGPGALTRWLRTIVADAAEVWVDAFPAGVTGELMAGVLPDVACHHLARRLRWQAYLRRLPPDPPRYATTWVTEPLGEAQGRWLAEHSERMEPLVLIDPPFDPAPAAALPLPEGAAIVIHSGPRAEVLRLMRYAGDHPIVVVAPDPPEPLPSGVYGWWQLAPAAPLADRPEVALVVTGAGASSMRQYAHLGPRHRAVPLARPLDDQGVRLAAALRKRG